MDETQVPIDGRLQFCQPPDTNWKRPFSGKLSGVCCALAVQSAEALPVIGCTDREAQAKELIFPQDTACIKDAFVIVLREGKNAKAAAAHARVRHDLFTT